MNYELRITNYQLLTRLVRYILLLISYFSLLTCIISCSPFPKEEGNNRTLNIQLVWNCYSCESSNTSLKTKAAYDDIVNAGVTTVVLKAEVDNSINAEPGGVIQLEADRQIITERSFPVEARYGELNGLPARIITATAEARDRDNRILFRGQTTVDLVFSTYINTTVTMNETPEYIAIKQSPSPGPTPTPISTPSTEPTIFPTISPEKVDIEMVSIPSGNFTMGSDDSDPDARADEKPQHTVYLFGYSISKYEITQAQYKKFIDATGHVAPTGDWDSVSKANYPVTYVNWDDAKAFCEWTGGRLPTEAEWEKAARGTDGRKYPWGNDNPTCELLNFNNCRGGTTSIGGYASNASPYGVMDMAGNVWEWCSDWYDEKYYSSSPSSNPQGSANGSNRIIRGGSWHDADINVRCSCRSYGTLSSNPVGIRLVKTD